jgi:hypothetical protein
MTAPRVAGVMEAAVRAQQSRIVGAAGTAAEPGFVRSSQQIFDDGDRFLARELNEPFDAARRAKPGLSRLDFLANAPEWVQDAARRLMGADQFIIETTSSATHFAESWVRVIESFRTRMPPADCGPGWAFWFRSTKAPDLSDTPLKIVPMDAPTASGTLPSWSKAQDRGSQFVALFHLIRQFPRADVTRLVEGLSGVELMRHLAPDASLGRLTSALDPDLRLSAWRWGLSLSTGRAPVLGSIRASNYVSANQQVSNRTVARWELAERLDEPAIIGHTEDQLEALTVSSTRPPGEPSDVFTQLSERELVEAALGRGPATEIRTIVAEIEHHRAQRATRMLESLITRLGLSADDATAVRHLTGHVDPNNLHMVTPKVHAMQDAWRWNGLWLQANPTRRDLIERTVLQFDSWTDHPDLARAFNAFAAYEPRQLRPVVELLTRPDVVAAAQTSDGLINRYNGLAGMINAAASIYAPNLAIPLIL